MSLGKTKIPYLTALWHPTTGCSFGCPTCWARSLVCNRLAGTMKGLPPAITADLEGNAEDGDPFAPTFHADRLADPLRVKKPQVIGVSFLGDLFDPAITDEQIAAVFGVMAVAPWHTFIVLTKRAERMMRWFAWLSTAPGYGPIGRIFDYLQGTLPVADLRRRYSATGASWPLPNVWIGVSVTNQADAYDRIMHLIRTPATHRWVSAEPLVAAVDMSPPLCEHCGNSVVTHTDGSQPWCSECDSEMTYANYFDTDGVGLDLVIAGGESGPKARPCHPDWARSLRDQCAAAGVAFNWKQWGEWAPDCLCGTKRAHRDIPRPQPGHMGCMFRCGTANAGRLLDGVLHDALPWRKP